MKEKRYTLPEEQEPAFAAEPAPAVAYHGERAGISYTVDEFFQKLHTERAWQK